MSNPFAAPPEPSAGIKWKDHAGDLFLIEPRKVEEDIDTTYGKSDAVVADVVILADNADPEEFPEALVFPKVLQNQLRKALGQKVLGRLGQGNAKPGQDAPWILEDPSKDDIEAGSKYLASQTTAPSSTTEKGGSSPF